MQLINFIHNNQSKMGLITADQAIDLSHFQNIVGDNTCQLLSLEKELIPTLKKISQLATSDQQINLAEITWQKPILKSNKIICVGLNYADHAFETKRPLPDFPVLFSRFNSSVVAHQEYLRCPIQSDKFDYEAELAVIIGKKAHNVKAQDAEQYIAGYSIFNDATVRDYQAKSSQWLLGKNFDQAGAFGPSLVLKEAVDLDKGLKIQTKLNDQILQDSNTNNLVFSCPQLIEIITSVMTLEVGDVIITGTPAGVGVARTPPIYMKEGDICEITIENLGTLQNKVLKAKV